MSEKPKYYFDTNIFLNFLFNEKNKFGSNMGNKAYNSFITGLSCKFNIIISSWTLFELKKKASNDEVRNMLSLLKPKIITISHTQNHIEKAKQKSPQHYEDYLHLLLALEAQADAIITRDIGFKEFEHLIKIKLPEQIS